MTELQFGEEAAKQLVAIYVTPDVISQRAEFLRALNPRPREKVLDVGSGPGFMTGAIAEAVGPRGAVRGVDISEPLLAVARAHCAGQPWVEFHRADATRLPFPDKEFDAAISTQVLEYVREVDAALAEIRRVLRPCGRVVIVDTDWDSLVWHSPKPEAMSRILAVWEQHAADCHLPRTMSSRLRQAGFQVENERVIPLFNPAYDPNTYSNRVIDSVVSFVSGKNGIARAEAEAWARELRQAGQRGEYFFSLNRYMFLAKRGVA
jgi:ubiquinone/menaquinone biosynthesis C-methylase UbiE